MAGTNVAQTPQKLLWTPWSLTFVEIFRGPRTSVLGDFHVGVAKRAARIIKRFNSETRLPRHLAPTPEPVLFHVSRHAGAIIGSDHDVDATVQKPKQSVFGATAVQVVAPIQAGLVNTPNSIMRLSSSCSILLVLLFSFYTRGSPLPDERRNTALSTMSVWSHSDADEPVRYSFNHGSRISLRLTAPA